MNDDFSLDPARHAGDLAVGAARALRAGDIHRAYTLADRRCRIRPPPDANDFLLRAAARRAMGDAEGAQKDIQIAAEIEPENPIAMRWLLNAAKTTDRRRAALKILQGESDHRLLSEAVSILAASGAPAVGCFTAGFGSIEGWIAWRGDTALEFTVRCDDATQAVRLLPERGHPLMSVLGNAASWTAPWPSAASSAFFEGFDQTAVIVGTVLSRTIPSSRPVRRRPTIAYAKPTTVTIVLPVYEDVDSTRLCLETLLADVPGHVTRTIVAIDDASPNPAISALLDTLAAAGEIVLLRNPTNLGFARSVNRALETIPAGDVLLLNADTVLPPGFLDRLVRAAYGAADIGSVTPLSNNGENTSLPRRFVENALPLLSEIRAIDAIAAEVNRGVVVDLPNGTGFCLYLRRDCLDGIGPLGTQFGRGYLEDVDFCLRASLAGFRNVCAADVYVGHAGTRSFGESKRALVVRNLRTIEAQYPGYERACAAFFTADPLAPMRAAIDARMLLRGGPYHLVVFGAAVDAEVIETHAAACRQVWPFVLVARAAMRAGRTELTIREAAGGFPQDLCLGAPNGSATKRLTALLAPYPIASIEVPDAASLPASVLQALERLHRPIITTPVEVISAVPTPVLLRPVMRRVNHLAIIAPPPSLTSFVRLRAIVRYWACRDDLPALAIVGETIDDLRLMASGPVIVSGPVALKDIPDLLRHLGASRLYLPAATTQLHPHRALAAAAGLPALIPGLPNSGKALPGGSLVIDPEMSDADAIQQLADWAVLTPLERCTA